jgi:hypothetical protein
MKMPSAREEFVVPERLRTVLGEMELQPQTFPPGFLSFEQQLVQIREYIECDEYGLAYESIIFDLKNYPLKLSGAAAVGLVEAALILHKVDD